MSERPDCVLAGFAHRSVTLVVDYREWQVDVVPILSASLHFLFEPLRMRCSHASMSATKYNRLPPTLRAIGKSSGRLYNVATQIPIRPAICLVQIAIGVAAPC